MSPTTSHSFYLNRHITRDTQRGSSNRFQLLADMPEHDSSNDAAAGVPSKKRTSRTAPRSHARRKYAKRASSGARANVVEGIDIAHSEIRLPAEHVAHPSMRNRGSALALESDEVYELWQDNVTSYDPHLQVMLPGDLTLNNLPRPSPPFTIRVKTKPAKREKHVALDDDDWDLVSNASDESFCMI